MYYFAVQKPSYFSQAYVFGFICWQFVSHRSKQAYTPTFDSKLRSQILEFQLRNSNLVKKEIVSET